MSKCFVCGVECGTFKYPVYLGGITKPKYILSQECRRVYFKEYELAPLEVQLDYMVNKLKVYKLNRSRREE